MKPDHQAVVAKDNTMIEKLSKFKLNELRLIAYCLAHYDSRGPLNKAFSATVEDLKELFPIDEKSAYGVVRSAIKGINSKPAEFVEGKVTKYRVWFTGFDYIGGEGKFEFQINKDVQPLLLGLKDTFTRYRLKDVYQFKSAHSWKLYENLKRWEAKKEWVVDLDELRVLLGVAGRYERWSDFQTRVVAPSVGEISDLSDLEVRYEKDKKGRTVVGVVFFIDKKQPDDVITVEKTEDGLYKELIRLGLHHKTARKYTNMAVKRDRVGVTVELLPVLVDRWSKNRQGTRIAYITGVLMDELVQKQMFENPVSEEDEKLLKEAVERGKKKSKR